MLSKSQIRYLRSLEHKKFRILHHAFLAEGNKVVTALLNNNNFVCQFLLANNTWLNTQTNIPHKQILIDDNNDIRKVSCLSTPTNVLAVFHLPNYNLQNANPNTQLILALDGIQNPGNLGTIIRLAHWFNIQHIVCSPDSADAFAPKTVQASSGALANVQVHYTDLHNFLANNANTATIYGAFTQGQSIYRLDPSPTGIIIMGNEGQGIRSPLLPLIAKRIAIPPLHNNTHTSESLNVAIATAIICSEFRRQTHLKHPTNPT